MTRSIISGITLGLLLIASDLASSAAQAGTPNFSVFDPPPAAIAPLSPAALQQAETNADLLAARAAVTTSDGKAATALYEAAIAAGNVVAMVELADLQDHVSDIGVRVDTQHAETLYHQAALLGYGLAQRRFAKIYETGDGVAEDQKLALAWYEFAADQGDDVGNTKLAVHYLGGEGGIEDFAKALHYAEQGERANGEDSRLLLGYLYLKGIGVAENDARAFHLIFLAAQQGDQQAQFRLVNLYARGIGIAVDRDQAQHWANIAEQYHPGGDWIDIPLD